MAKVGLTRALASYERALMLRPLLTKAATSGAVAMSGDFLAQRLLEDRKSLDLGRLARFALLGGVLVGPTLHYWYGALNRHVVGASARATVTRVVLDQFVFSPVFLGIFFPCLGTLEGKSVPEIQAQLGEIWAPTVVRNWAWWIPVQVANFGFVPPHYQVLVSNLAGAAWNCYLSHVARH